MKSLDRKEVVELIGLAAIVASLIFVGIQLRQSQNIALAEGYSMHFAARIDVSNSIKEHSSIWRKGTAGEELQASEMEVFSVLVYQVNQSAVQAFLNAWQVSGEEEARFSARDFAGFLYQNPGARAVWIKREDNLLAYRRLLNDHAGSEDDWTEIVREYLAELDQLNPEVVDDVFVDW